MGGVSTVWQGSAFQCPGQQNAIPLSHSHYITSNGTYISKSCNDGGVTIVAQIVRVSENIYTSQVTINDRASMPSLIGKSVKCVRDNGTATEVVVSYNIINNSNNASKRIIS